MSTFQEIGKYLDKLELEKKFDLLGKIAEDVLYPKINDAAKTLVEELKLSRCTPKVNYDCIKLTSDNKWLVKDWLRQECGFDVVAAKDFGLQTEYGDIKWGDWIVREPGDATVFYDNEFFRQNFLVILLKNDEM